MGGLFSTNKNSYLDDINTLRNVINNGKYSDAVEFIKNKKIIEQPIKDLEKFIIRLTDPKETFLEGATIELDDRVTEMVKKLISELIKKLNNSSNKSNVYKDIVKYHDHIRSSVLPSIVNILMSEVNKYDDKIETFLKEAVILNDHNKSSELKSYSLVVRKLAYKNYSSNKKLNNQTNSRERLEIIVNAIDEKIMSFLEMNAFFDKIAPQISEGGQYTEEQFLAKYKKYKQKYIQLQNDLRQ